MTYVPIWVTVPADRTACLPEAIRLDSRLDRESKAHPDESKAVCEVHERAYVVSIGCPYCE